MFRAQWWDGGEGGAYATVAGEVKDVLTEDGADGRATAVFLTLFFVVAMREDVAR